MESRKSVTDSFNEEQSIQVIREMISVSQKRLKNDGILFIIWGWLFFAGYLFDYLSSKIVMTYQIRKFANTAGIVLAIAAMLYTGYYIYIQKRKVFTYIGVSLRYVWISLFFSLVLVNLIQANVVHEINFNLQHPIFMVFIAFATVITGGILRYRLLIAGGIAFALLAYASSYLPLHEQLLLEAVAWGVAFVIPGHIMHHNRKK
ncbi:MAG: hypothetical protein JXB19_08635 [Bacteroidales bacterium]|nr:hypothetical protein [Bacteroidales bacterium]